MSQQVQLRPVTRDDLPVLAEIQSDPLANDMAAIKRQPPAALLDFLSTWMFAPGTVARVILADGEVVGSLSCFDSDGLRTVGYWLARSHWGRGIASQALKLFLDEIADRPLHARVASTNHGSIRVLQKAGFTIERHQHSPATDRYIECEEAVLILR